MVVPASLYMVETAPDLDAVIGAIVLLLFGTVVSTFLLIVSLLGLAATLDTPLVRPIRRLSGRLTLLALLMVLAVAAAVAGFELVQGIIGERLPTGAAVVGAIVAPALLVPLRTRLERWAGRVADRALPDVEDTPEYRALRKIAVYRFAVENATDEGDEETLEILRQELGLPQKVASQIEGDTPGRRRGSPA